MVSFHAGKLSIKGKGLCYKLLIIVALIFVLPFLVISYIFYRNNVILEFSQIVIFVLTLILILAGLIILRQLFDRFLMVANLIKKAEGSDKYLIDMQKDTAELYEIIVSFNSLMKNFEETTDELRHRVFELFAIKELVEVASKSLDIDDLLNVLTEKAMAVSKAQIGSVYMVESEKRRFRVVTSRGLESGPKKDSYINFNESLARLVVSEKKPLLVQDIETDSRTRKPNDPKYGPPSFLSMPIFVKENLISVLNLSHKETKQDFDLNDEQILSIMTGEIGFALENAQLHSRVREHLKNLQQRSVELTNANDQLQQEITEHKLTEEALRKAHAELDLRAEERTAELMKANEQLKREIEGRKRAVEKEKELVAAAAAAKTEKKKSAELEAAYKELRETQAKLTQAGKMAAMGTLGAGVAHQLNQPLAGIRGFTQAILIEMDKENLFYKDLKIIEEQTGYMREIISNISGFARAAGFKKEPIDINEPIDKALDLLSEQLRLHGIKLIKSLKPDLPGVNADFNQMQQVIVNFIVNAREALDGLPKDAKKELTITTRVQGKKPGGLWIEVEFTDTGTGIQDEIKDRVYEPFFTNKGPRSTGLGLYLNYQIIKDHGGSIDLKSEIGKGTTFKVILPAIKAKSGREEVERGDRE